jgi:hypothetical protein
MFLGGGGVNECQPAGMAFLDPFSQRIFYRKFFIVFLVITVGPL